MSVTQIFVNLPVADVAKSKAFYEGLGFSINQQFTDENAACVVLGESICAMIMTPERFKEFTAADVASSGIEVINALGVTTREGVDHVTDAAIAGGGGETRPTMDMGWMYHRGFADLDGHHWEVVYVDEDAMNAAFAESRA